MQRPRVGADRRRFKLPDGTPFFWLGDTAWELFHRLDRDETEHYLKTRAEQGFNVVQAVALAEFDGLKVPNRYGEVPLRDLDPTKPNEAYWRHVDWVVERAAHHGLYVGLLPTWGDKIVKAWGVGPEVFDEASARSYGRWVGRRYSHCDNVIWIVGGDRTPGDRIGVFRAMAEGLREGDDSHERLMTLHPSGDRSSADDFHADGWLDFNMMQTGHGHRELEHVARMTRASYAKSPPKPVLDGEPRYENHPIGFDMKNGYFDGDDFRRAAYTSVFCGGAGVTYGCHAMWQFAQDRYAPVNNPISHWRYSLGLPGAQSIRHLKELILSLPPMAPVVEAAMPTLVGDGRRAVYAANGETVEVAASRRGEWFDPTTGERRAAGVGSRFAPPRREGRTNDWVLLT